MNTQPQFQSTNPSNAVPRFNDSNPPPQMNTQPQFQSTNPSKVQEPDNTLFQPKTGGALCFRNIFRNLFYLHLCLITVLVAALTVRGFLFAANNHHRFRPLKFYPPLLSSTAVAAIVALSWQSFTLLSPSRTLKAAFWLSPLLTCAMGILLLSVGSAGSLAAAAIALVSAIVQSLYSCWASPRFDHAARVLSVSMSPPPPKTGLIVFLAVAGATLYWGFLVAGIGGATATGTGLDAVFILVIVLSQTWTMNVIKNTLGVVISRVKYQKFACGSALETGVAFRDAMKYSIGGICVGSFLVPVLGLVRGSARAISLVSGDADEFLFSCANCYSGVASRLVTYGNRWGFVHVGVYNKSFVQSSIDTWEMFRRVELEPLIDSDLTSSFCFLCGVATGGVCALAGGTWSLVVHNGYATEVPIYAFLIGYFMCRVAMAWPQACVSAYYVAYAENPENLQFDSTIPVRMQELQLQRTRAQNSRVTHTTEF